MLYKVEYNKHKYQDCSDRPHVTSKIVPAESPEEAGYKLSDLRDTSDVEGLRAQQGNRYYIGLIHFNNITPA